MADDAFECDRIQREAEVTGICKIVPPKGWRPHFAIDLNDETNMFETRLQRIHQLQVLHIVLIRVLCVSIAKRLNHDTPFAIAARTGVR